MKVSFEGIGELVATFYNNGAENGYPVKLSANREVKACASGERFIGVAVSPSEEYTGVLLGGCVTLPYSGTAPALGCAKLSADGSGGVKADSAGSEYIVLDVDSTSGTICIIL